MVPQLRDRATCQHRTRGRKKSRPTRPRALLSLGLLLLLSALLVGVSSCTTEVITAVPPDTVENPEPDEDPEEDEDPEGEDDSGEDDGSGEDDDSDENDDSDDEDDDSDDEDDDSDDEDDDSDDEDDDSDDEDDDSDDEDDGGDDDEEDDDSVAVGQEWHGFPRGHMPPPGACRIWDPDLSAGRQSSASGDCDELRARLPAGSWLLYRPNEQPRVFRIA